MCFVGFDGLLSALLFTIETQQTIGGCGVEAAAPRQRSLPASGALSS